MTSPQDFHFTLIHRVTRVIKKETMRSVSQNFLLTSFGLNSHTLLEICNLEILHTYRNVLLIFKIAHFLSISLFLLFNSIFQKNIISPVQ